MEDKMTFEFRMKGYAWAGTIQRIDWAKRVAIVDITGDMSGFWRSITATSSTGVEVDLDRMIFATAQVSSHTSKGLEAMLRTRYGASCECSVNQ